MKGAVNTEAILKMPFSLHCSQGGVSKFYGSTGIGVMLKKVGDVVSKRGRLEDGEHREAVRSG